MELGLAYAVLYFIYSALEVKSYPNSLEISATGWGILIYIYFFMLAQ